jgi:hypothetical protein
VDERDDGEADDCGVGEEDGLPERQALPDDRGRYREVHGVAHVAVETADDEMSCRCDRRRRPVPFEHEARKRMCEREAADRDQRCAHDSHRRPVRERLSRLPPGGRSCGLVTTGADGLADGRRVAPEVAGQPITSRRRSQASRRRSLSRLPVAVREEKRHTMREACLPDVAEHASKFDDGGTGSAIAAASPRELAVERLQVSRFLEHLVGHESGVALQHADREVAGREEEAPHELKLGD